MLGEYGGWGYTKSKSLWITDPLLMSEDHPEFEQHDDEQDIPASVTFMEMMRQAANRAQRQSGAQAGSVPAVREKSAASPPPAPIVTETPPAPSDAVVDEKPPVPPADAPAALLTQAERSRQLKYESALEAERIRRVKRRKARRRRNAASLLGGFIRSFMVVFAAAGLMATIFTWWTPSQFIATGVRSELSIAQATSQATLEPTGLPTPNWFRRIGIVSGHRGPEGDPGAVCPDGLTEAEINFAVAQEVVRKLRGLGYSVDLLDEFDPRLDNYQAAALVSIHANTCQVWPGEVVSGYLIAAAAARVSSRAEDNMLVECVAQHYYRASGLQRREGVTVDMTDYHTFREIHSRTPAVIIELGFMLADREILTQQQEVLANGITEGVLCYLNPNQAPPAAATSTPEAS